MMIRAEKQAKRQAWRQRSSPGYGTPISFEILGDYWQPWVSLRGGIAFRGKVAPADSKLKAIGPRY